MALVIPSKFDLNSNQNWVSTIELSIISKFPNREECSERGGTAQGNCANGYGVCCISKKLCSISIYLCNTNNNFSVVSISCGSSSRDNNTYLRLGPISSFDSSNENCNYRICQTNNKICRIRLDFNTFSIQGPELGTTLATAGTTANTDGTEIIWHYHMGQRWHQIYHLAAQNCI